MGGGVGGQAWLRQVGLEKLFALRARESFASQQERGRRRARHGCVAGVAAVSFCFIHAWLGVTAFLEIRHSWTWYAGSGSFAVAQSGCSLRFRLRSGVELSR